MAALTSITPTNTGAVSAGTAVAASDTIALSQMGPRGCYLEITNGSGGDDNITISDAGQSPAGNAVGTIADTIATGTSQIYRIHRSQANTSTGNVTVTHSATTSVTCKVFQAL